ncbi:MAG: hypothetical protein ABIQ27_12840 [Flavobacterium sp.]|uniref:hypothetical protein n=1 Tax=Flavobacterium sp. TaxID=239 RepID=UPI003266481C
MVNIIGICSKQTLVDERGFAIENVIWWWLDTKDKMPTAWVSDKFNPVSQTSLLRAKKGVLPTLPKANRKKITVIVPQKQHEAPAPAKKRVLKPIYKS